MRLIRTNQIEGLTDFINNNINTRIKLMSSEVYASGDINFINGNNTTITQSGNNFTFSSVDTTYSAGNGLTLTGTTFSLPITVSGSGNAVTGVTQTTNGLTINKDANYSLTTHTHTFAELTSKPTTLSGYGITDAMSTSHAANGITSALITNWNTAYTNNHTHSNKTNLDSINQNLSTTSNVVFGSVTGTSFIKSGGTSAQFLKADGSVDTTIYTTFTQSLASLITSTSTTGVSNVATTNTNTYLNIVQNGASPTTSSSTQITGSGSVTVTSDANGKVTITGTNTTYSAGTLALITTGTDTTSRVWTSQNLRQFVDQELNYTTSDSATLVSKAFGRTMLPLSYAVTSKVGEISLWQQIMGTGSPIYGDMEFSNGNNNIVAYGANSTITRVDDDQFSGNSTGKIIKVVVQNNGPYGWHDASSKKTASPNQTTIQLFRAIVPIGYRLQHYNNNIGTGNIQKWLTSTHGTGRWEWYAKLTICGEVNGASAFSNYGHVGLQSTNTTTYPVATVDTPQIMYISHHETFDMLKNIGTSLSTMKLKTPITIDGVSFDGSQNITLPNSHTHSNKTQLDSINQSLSTTSNVIFGTITGTSFIKSGGTSTQFLKADGSVDSTVYTTFSQSLASLITSTSTTGVSNVATTNTNTYLNIVQNGTSPTASSSTQLTGSGSVTVASDTSGKVTITGTDTTYSDGTLAILTSGTDATTRVWKAKDLVDYYNSRISTRYINKKYGTFSSYKWFVVPLFEYTTDINQSNNFFYGEITFNRSNGNGSTRDIVKAYGGSVYNQQPSIIFESSHSLLTLVKYTYNEKTYLGVCSKISATHDELNIKAFTSNVDLHQPIAFYKSDETTIIDAEINSSVQEYTEVRKTIKQNYNIETIGSVKSEKIIKSGGTSTQFLKADGSVDSTVYTTFSQSLASLITSTSATGTSNVATTNTNTYLNIVQNGTSPTASSSTQLTGSGSVTIASDTSGKVTITGTDTTYSAGNGLTLSGTAFSLPITVSGSGNVVTGVTQTTNGLTINKDATYSLSTHTHTFTELTSKPTTLSGYGITDAMSTSHVANGITSALITNWNTAFTNNHTHSNKTQLDSINQSLSTTSNVTFGTITGTSFVKSGGTSSQFLKADGSVDSTVYTTFSQSLASLITSTSATGTSNVATTNTNTYLNIVQNGTSPTTSSSTQITGTGSVTVTSDTTGKVTITGVDTTYSAGNGLTLSGTAFSLPITVSGSGNVVTGVTQTTNGLTINKDATYSLSTHTHSFAELTSKPTTLSGYGITDAMSTSHVANGITSTLITNWNTAYTNNHTHSNKTQLDSINQSLSTASNVTFGTITGTSFVKSGGTSSQFLKADGSVDSTVYTTFSQSLASLITSTSATGTSNVATTNTNTYLNIVQNGASPTTSSSTQITGANGITVTSDATGKVTITGSGSAYALPLSSSTVRGGIMVGYTATSTNGTVYNAPVELSSEKAYVSITKTAITTALGLTPTANSGTVTSVALSMPTPFTVSSSPITSSGTLTVALSSGYTIPTTSQISSWNDAVMQKHTHTNMTYLNTLNQGLSTYDIPIFKGIETKGGKTKLSLEIINNTIPTVAGSSDYTLLVSRNGDSGITFDTRNNIGIIQMQHTDDTTTTTYELKVNPLGGLVSIGGGGLTSSGVLTVNNTSTLRQVNPQTNNTYDLGTSSLRWKTLYGISANFSGLLYTGPLEITHATPFIDFHFNNTTTDFTSRIIETATNYLEIIATNGITTQGNFLPYNSTYTIGTTDRKWSNVWANSVNNLVLTSKRVTASNVSTLKSFLFDSTNTDGISVFRSETTLNNGMIQMYGASLAVSTGDTIFTLSSNPLNDSLYYSSGNNTNNSTTIKRIAYTENSVSLTATAFYESSLRKYKTNIKEFKTDAISLINTLKIVTYDRIDDGNNSIKNKIGIIADDTDENFLSENKDAVDIYKTVFIQAKAIQTLSNENKLLKAEIEEIKRIFLNK